VRAAATLGGNLVLTRDLGLESDAATLLIAAGAEVQTASPSNKAAWQSVESFVSGTRVPNQGEVVIAIRLPAVKPADRFWSFKVSSLFSCYSSKRLSAIPLCLALVILMLVMELWQGWD